MEHINMIVLQNDPMSSLDVKFKMDSGYFFYFGHGECADLVANSFKKYAYSLNYRSSRWN